MHVGLGKQLQDAESILTDENVDVSIVKVQDVWL